MRYLDDELEWSEPEVGPSAHSIIYKMTPPTEGYATFADTNPNSARAGEQFTVTLNIISGYKLDFAMGYTTDTDAEYSNIDEMEHGCTDTRRVGFPMGEATVDNTFTMPDSDIVVWFSVGG